jgi:hypothetical protein
MKILKCKKNDGSHYGTGMPARGFFEQNAVSNQDDKVRERDLKDHGSVKYKKTLHIETFVCFHSRSNYLKKTP